MWELKFKRICCHLTSLAKLCSHCSRVYIARVIAFVHFVFESSRAGDIVRFSYKLTGCQRSGDYYFLMRYLDYNTRRRLSLMKSFIFQGMLVRRAVSKYPIYNYFLSNSVDIFVT